VADIHAIAPVGRRPEGILHQRGRPGAGFLVVDLGWTAAAVLGVFMAVNGVYMLVSPGNFRIA